MRRLPKWRPPTEGQPDNRSITWPGRWALVRTSGIMGASDDESTLAEAVARQWLDRYGVVTRDWWKRERPTVSWRAIYRELKRLEFRGDVRRGYFVRGLAGAQFALPSAVEQLRTSGPATPVTEDGESRGTSIPLVVMAASDPANPYSLAVAGSGESASAALAAARHPQRRSDPCGGRERSTPNASTWCEAGRSGRSGTRARATAGRVV